MGTLTFLTEAFTWLYLTSKLLNLDLETLIWFSNAIFAMFKSNPKKTGFFF